MPNIKIPLFVKVAASGLLLLFVLLRVDLQSLASIVARSNLFLILLAAVVGLSCWVINTYKWQVLLQETGTHVKYPQLLQLTFIGIFYNLVLPGQVGGEVVKSVRLARMGVGAAPAAVSVVADRTTGLFALLVLGIAGLALSPSIALGQVNLLPWVLGLALVLATTSVVLITGRGPAAMLALGKALRVPGRRFHSKLDAMFLNALGPARDVSSIGMLLLLSLLAQASVSVMNLFICMALGIHVTFFQLLWIVAVVSLLQALPISIAGIGVREGAYVYLLQQMSVAGASALALSLLVFAMQVFMAALGGLLQLRELLRERQHEC